MKIKVLGSSAAEAVPALWCECPVCAHARKNKGCDVRRRTCYLIDDDTLVDFGPDIYAQTLEFDIDLTRIRRILITHSHEDHLNPVDLSWRRPGFSHVTKEIDLYANQSSLNRILAQIPAPGFSLHKIREHLLSPGVSVTSGDIRIFPIEASHASPEETALNFVLERNGAVAGFAACRPLPERENSALLDSLHVAPEAQGGGWGRKLIAQAARWARERGYRELTVYVVQGNHRAERLYRRLGARELYSFHDWDDALSWALAWEDLEALEELEMSNLPAGEEIG